jgi:hypothetical protein
MKPNHFERAAINAAMDYADSKGVKLTRYEIAGRSIHIDDQRTFRRLFRGQTHIGRVTAGGLFVNVSVDIGPATIHGRIERDCVKASEESVEVTL